MFGIMRQSHVAKQRIMGIELSSKVRHFPYIQGRRDFAFMSSQEFDHLPDPTTLKGTTLRRGVRP